jgi:hypothetical protein
MTKIILHILVFFCALICTSCSKEKEWADFIAFDSDQAGSYIWVESMFNEGTDSMYTVYANEVEMEYQFVALRNDADISVLGVNAEVLIYRDDDIILRFKPLYYDIDHLLDPETGHIMEGFAYWYNAQGERLEIKWFGDLDHPWLRYPYSNAINIYERVD